MKEFGTSEHNSPHSSFRQCGLHSLRAGADALGLDLASLIALEKTNPSRAYIRFKLMLGERISATSNICELRALNKLWDDLCAIQYNSAQGANTWSLGWIGLDSPQSPNDSQTIH